MIPRTVGLILLDEVCHIGAVFVGGQSLLRQGLRISQGLGGQLFQFLLGPLIAVVIGIHDGLGREVEVGVLEIIHIIGVLLVVSLQVFRGIGVIELLAHIIGVQGGQQGSGQEPLKDGGSHELTIAGHEIGAVAVIAAGSGGLEGGNTGVQIILNILLGVSGGDGRIV